MATSRIDSSSSATTHVSFVCQKCRQPLKLDPTFSTLSQSLVTDLSAPLTNSQDGGRDSITRPFQQLSLEHYEEDPNITRLTVAPPKTDEEVNSGFTLLGETDSGNMGNLGHRLKVSAVLFDILSGNSEIDHPLCQECADSLLDQLDLQLKQTEDECKDYRDFLDKLNSSEESVDDSSLDEELKQLRLEEQQLQQELEKMELEQQEQDLLIAKEKQLAQELDEAEAKYYRDYSDLKRHRMELEDEHMSVENQMQFATAQLNKLKQVNVFNSTFHIWHDGQFGTINGFRLGRLPNIQVEWSEINAAWGQAALLLHSMARKAAITFKKYRLVPYGSYSYIENLDYDKKKKDREDKSEKKDIKEYSLYGSGGFKFFWDSNVYRFDMGMAAFLNCLEQLWDKITDGNQLPYLIKGDKLEDQKHGNSFSIKTQFNCEEQWTKALKFMLTDLKWCLSIMQAQGAKGVL